ncbi:MAG: formylmethanofuran dehydrogenase subunit C [Desulfatiglans sp.]|jgi:formylmethanofuran dehydrogenase subunit C|nr:formylmethanofuran dehydrogenase subunit C [Desulfatiglans sp.]
MAIQIHLILKKIPDIPVEAENIKPENIAGKSAKDIKDILILVGKSWEPAGEWFDVDLAEVQNDSAEIIPPDLIVNGDLTRFKRLGEGMSQGRMRIDGPVGFHAGARMCGGELIINGNTGDYLGAHMKAGLIVVNGNAGHYTAAAYRGHTKGMAGGTIVIKGNAGQMLGARMRRGLIYVTGGCGDSPGFNMKAGTIIIGGTPGARAGARMVRGTIMLLNKDSLPELLPTFTCNCTYTPPFWPITRGILSKMGFAPETEADAFFTRYSGDTNEGGRGEVLVKCT